MALIQRDGLRVVVGLGKTGLSCVRFLKSRGYPVAVNDTRENPPGLAELRAEFPDVQVSLGRLDEHLLLSAREIVASPGISVKEPELVSARLNAGIPIVGDIDIFCREVNAPIVAITGSNAKSTVTTLVGLMAKNAGIDVGVGGNLGLPVLDMLREQGEQALYVLELSSFQLETTHSLKAAVTVVLNMSEDHMDRYASMQEYHAAKHRIFRNCQRFVVNRDDPLTRPLIAESIPNVSFGLNAPDLNQFGVLMEGNEKWLARGREKLMPVSAVKIRGDHNVANVLAALALGEAVQLPMDVMLQTLRDFPGLPHRCELVTEQDGVAWYNDSKGTNVGSTLAAINGLGNAIRGKLILIAGGVGKGQDFTPLSAPLLKFGKTLVLIGEDGPKIGAAVADGVQKVQATTLRDAIEKAKALAADGDAVLLSPACASFDMFKNYEDRGQQFVATVKDVVGAR
ncbi:MAG: UDP-N-acetylmuramoyl-L-alanine--D-glutamate ligase [Moraxellaceae bacterium]|jgi:UDP-N-acetylmuramoylalanine--D-glutamate ligase|nr:UDP-N-acetylmuramoyl-L-alanine--D-glutamate ligase [Moraxellaceae bacterium]